MSINPQLFEYLQFSALIFFNIFCILAVFVSIALLVAVNTMRNKFVEVTDKVNDSIEQVKESTLNMNELGFNIFSLISPFVFGRRNKKESNGLASLLKRIFDR